MTIIFFNTDNNKLYICTENDMMRQIDPKDPQLMSTIPNDDILYVRNGSMFSKQQFQDFIDGKGNYEVAQQQYDQDFDPGLRLNPQSRYPVANTQQSYEANVRKDRHYIHPTHNGTVLIEDIRTDRFPHGLELAGKYHFVAIDEIGQDILEESHHFRTLHAKGKIEIVSHEYVMKNQHKNRKQDAREAALDAIIIPDSRRGAALDYADRGYGVRGAGRTIGGDDFYDPGGNNPIEIDIY